MKLPRCPSDYKLTLLWAQRFLCIVALLVLLACDLLPIWSKISIFPFFPLIAIFYLYVIRPDILTIDVLICLGVVQDSIYGYPLGLSIFLNILLYALLRSQSKIIDRRSFAFLWVVFLAFTLIAYTAHWMLVCYTRHEWLNFTPRLLGALLTAALFPWGVKLLAYVKK